MTDRNRFARQFDRMRDSNQEPPAPGGEESSPHEDPETAQPERASPRSDDPSPFLFDPTSVQQDESDENASESDGADAWEGVPEDRSGGPEEDFAGDPWESAGLALRTLVPEPEKDANGVMTMIRQDIAYRQGKMVEEEKAEKAKKPGRRSEGAEDVKVQRASKKSLLPGVGISLPEIPGIAMEWGRGVLSLAILLIAITYAVSSLGFGGSKYFVHFTVDAPSASEVTLLGDFNGWNRGATPLGRLAGSTVWEVWVSMEPGRYRYAFLIDGKLHMVDRSRLSQFDDELQRGVSIVVVPRGGGTPELIGDKEAAAASPPSPEPQR